MSRSSPSLPLNSDMSRRCIFSSPPKKIFAKALAVSVFPTPVGPKNRNDPIGRSEDWMPARARRIVRAIASSARSCPTTCWCSLSSRCKSRSRSVSSIGPAGTPVLSLTTWYTKSAEMKAVDCWFARVATSIKSSIALSGITPSTTYRSAEVVIASSAG